MTIAEEILALQIAEDPDFLAKREVLYQAVVEAESKMRICAEPEYGLLVQAVTDARNAFAAQGVHWVHHVHCGNAEKAASLALANQQARDEVKAERHREVDRESKARARDKVKPLDILPSLQAGVSRGGTDG
jgi:hypothetical protein